MHKTLRTFATFMILLIGIIAAPATYALDIPNPPGTPTAVAGNGDAEVSWSEPVVGDPAASYTVTSSPDGLTCTATAPATSCTVEGLTNGTAYTFTVVATNDGGDSSASVASNSVTPTDVVPGAPEAPTAVAGNGDAEVSWTAPSTGGASVSYTVTSSPDGLTCEVDAPATSCTVAGLTNGTAYTFTVVATNTGGDSSASVASNSVTPTDVVPGAPEAPTAVAGNGDAEVSWTAPSTGGASVSYTVTSSPDGLTCEVDAPATSCTVAGLTNGTAYTFTVVATNTGGDSSASVASNSVTPTDVVDVVPGAPGTPTAVAGDGEAEVSWIAPSTGGASVSYTVTSSPDGLTCTATAPATTCTVAGLTNGTAYTFTVVATNDGGDSSASVASNSVTPVQSQADEYEVTITKSGKGSFSNGSATVEDGDTFSSTATPKKGHKFKGWTCEPDSLDTTAKTISFTVTEDVSCVATFKKKSTPVSDLKVVFESDGWKLGNKQATMLLKQVAIFKAGSFSTITITGYTDSLGTVKNNANLSLARAKAVRNFMMQYLPKAKFVVEAGGSSNPVASNATEEGRAQNRRAEISFS